MFSVMIIRIITIITLIIIIMIIMKMIIIIIIIKIKIIITIMIIIRIIRIIITKRTRIVDNQRKSMTNCQDRCGRGQCAWNRIRKIKIHIQIKENANTTQIRKSRNMNWFRRGLQENICPISLKSFTPNWNSLVCCDFLCFSNQHALFLKSVHFSLCVYILRMS